MNDNKQIVRSSFWANLFKTPTDKTDLIEILMDIPIFSKLSRREITSLLNIIHDRSYIAREYIFLQGDPGIGMYIIRDGKVRVERKLDSNETIPLATFKNGDFFGELALLDDERRSASAIAETDVKLAVIFKPDLDDYIFRFPKKGVKILQGISHIVAVRLRQLNEEHIKFISANK